MLFSAYFIFKNFFFSLNIVKYENGFNYPFLYLRKIESSKGGGRSITGDINARTYVFSVFIFINCKYLPFCMKQWKLVSFFETWEELNIRY